MSGSDLENNYHDVLCMECGTTIDLDNDHAVETDDNNGEETFLCGHCGEGLIHCELCWRIVDTMCRGQHPDGHVSHTGGVVCGKCVPDNEDIGRDDDDDVGHDQHLDDDPEETYTEVASSSGSSGEYEEEEDDDSEGELNEENEDYYSCKWTCAKCKCHIDSRGYEGITDNNNCYGSRHNHATTYFCHDCMNGMDQCEKCLCVVDIHRRGGQMDGFSYYTPYGFLTTRCFRCAPSNDMMNAYSSFSMEIEP